MTTVGAVFLPQLPPERLRAVALAADRAGLEQLWLWEDCFLEGGISAATAALAFTTNLRVGIGVLPVPLRNAALTAMELATVHRLFPGRALIGLGHGIQDWMGQVGGRVSSPLTLLAEHLDATRALLAGQRVTAAGRYVHLDGVQLVWPPAGPVAVLAAAEGPKTLKLSGAHSDGTVLASGTTPGGVRRARTLIDEAREAAGRLDADHPIVVYLIAGGGAGTQERVRQECLRWGWPDHAGCSVSGVPSTVAEQARRWVDAGADTVVLQPTSDEPSHEGFMEFAAEVGTLLR